NVQLTEATAYERSRSRYLLLPAHEFGDRVQRRYAQMKTCTVVFAGILVAIAALGQTRSVQNELLTKIREGDLSRVAALLGSGTDPNTRDEAGSTAVMHAAAFASVDMI